MIPGSANPLLLAGAAEAGAYSISRSVRLNSADSAYLSRTPTSAGNRKTWTWAGWVKRSKLSGTIQKIFTAGTSGSSHTGIQITAGEQLEVFHYASSYVFRLVTTQVLRDVSAWMHITVAVDSTQAISSNRVKVYINGSQVITFATSSYPATQNADYEVNNTSFHAIAKSAVTVESNYVDGYLADIHFIDGQALDPTSFGEFDDNGIWQPIAYSGTYGTNGFHLPFSDNSTAAALGTDTSGNSNTWTVNNISVTAGAGNDSLVDVPTNGTETDTGVGGEVRGNYCTWNPLDLAANAVLANGNLDVASTTQSWSGSVRRGTVGVSSGKWYWEITCNTNISGSANIHLGIATSSVGLNNYLGSDAFGWAYTGFGTKYNNDSTSAYGTANWTSGTVIGVAFDADAGTLTFYNNNTSQGQAYSGLTSGPYFPAISVYNASAVFNAGSRPFAYTAPSGFKALCTANLPTPVVTKPSEYMDVALYTGNGSTQTISGLEFSPDFVWVKDRTFGDDHMFTDTVRGATKAIRSNSTIAETTNSEFLTAFTSDGFSVGNNGNFNRNANQFVAWTWDAGSSTVSNPDGSITSTVRANPSAGFSIVTYTGNGTAGATIGHGLGVAPEMIIIKNRDQADAWQVYHAANTANPETDYLVLNTTAATADNANRWNDTAPGASVFTLGNGAEVNTNTEDYVAYCFTGLDGYTAMSSYTGNGNTDGPFVFTNMRPRWILIKRTDTTSNWTIIDTAREGYNVDNDPLFPNLSNAEGTADLADILSNGFKLRTTDASVNANTGTYIYFAIAEAAFNYSRAR